MHIVGEKYMLCSREANKQLFMAGLNCSNVAVSTAVNKNCVHFNAFISMCLFLIESSFL